MTISHDAQLIILGAGLSLVSSLITAWFTNWLEERRKKRERLQGVQTITLPDKKDIRFVIQSRSGGLSERFKTSDVFMGPGPRIEVIAILGPIFSDFIDARFLGLIVFVGYLVGVFYNWILGLFIFLGYLCLAFGVFWGKYLALKECIEPFSSEWQNLVRHYIRRCEADSHFAK